MDDERYNAKRVRRRFEHHIQELIQLDAGAHMADPDKPMDKFNGILDYTAFNPITNDDQLHILHKGMSI